MGLSHGKCEFGTGLSSKFFKLKSHPFIFDQSRPRTIQIVRVCGLGLRREFFSRLHIQPDYRRYFLPKTQNRLSEINVKI